MLNRRAIALGLILSLLYLAIPSQTRSQETDINARIRKEGMEHSQIMKTMHILSDVYGSRLTGSPNHKRAAEWTIKQMTGWGLVNGHLDP